MPWRTSPTPPTPCRIPLNGRAAVLVIRILLGHDNRPRPPQAPPRARELCWPSVRRNQIFLGVGLNSDTLKAVEPPSSRRVERMERPFRSVAFHKRMPRPRGGAGAADGQDARPCRPAQRPDERVRQQSVHKTSRTSPLWEASSSISRYFRSNYSVKSLHVEISSGT